jgi:CheY-like chemotaxis protein
VRVESEPGRGSTFRIDLLLPCTDPAAEEEELAESPRPRTDADRDEPPGPAPAIPSAAAVPDPRAAATVAPHPAASGRPLRVLLAEDNEVNRRVAGLMLESLGAMVDFVGDGREAVELRFRNRYDVILMDLQMPRMDGLEATRTIRSCEADGDRVPIIALTANAFPSDRQRCLDAGMDHHLRKPIRRAALEDALRRAAPPAPRA